MCTQGEALQGRHGEGGGGEGGRQAAGWGQRTGLSGGQGCLAAGLCRGCSWHHRGPTARPGGLDLLLTTSLLASIARPACPPLPPPPGGCPAPEQRHIHHREHALRLGRHKVGQLLLGAQLGDDAAGLDVVGGGIAVVQHACGGGGQGRGRAGGGCVGSGGGAGSAAHVLWVLGWLLGESGHAGQGHGSGPSLRPHAPPPSARSPASSLPPRPAHLPRASGPGAPRRGAPTPSPRPSRTAPWAAPPPPEHHTAQSPRRCRPAGRTAATAAGGGEVAASAQQRSQPSGSLPRWWQPATHAHAFFKPVPRQALPRHAKAAAHLQRQEHDILALACGACKGVLQPAARLQRRLLVRLPLQLRLLQPRLAHVVALHVEHNQLVARLAGGGVAGGVGSTRSAVWFAGGSTRQQCCREPRRAAMWKHKMRLAEWKWAQAAIIAVAGFADPAGEPPTCFSWRSQSA